MAHEINNPVNGVINYAQIILDDLKSKEVDPDIPIRIIKEGRRIGTIVKSLLSFAREIQGDREPVRFQDLLANSLDLVGAQLRKDGIILKMDVSNPLPEVDAHAQQLQQVLLNLLSNARYALNQKYSGKDEHKIIEITVQTVTLDAFPYVKMSIFDAGVGIPAHNLDKVIRPFFTTKPMGLGTGLGLSISHSIVADHGGRLHIQSQEGTCTRVEIL